MIIDRARIVECGLAYLGTPYAHQGRLLGVGVDCYGLIGCAYHDAGYALDMRANYAMEPSQDELYRWMDEHFDYVSLTRVRPGDVLVFRMVVQAQHMALVASVDPVVMLHAYRRVGSVVRHELVAPWSGLLMSAHALKGSAWVA